MCVLLFHRHLRLVVLLEHFFVSDVIVAAATSANAVLNGLHILELIIYLFTSVALAGGGLYWFLICKWFSDVSTMFLLLFAHVGVALAA